MGGSGGGLCAGFSGKAGILLLAVLLNVSDIAGVSLTDDTGKSSGVVDVSF